MFELTKIELIQANYFQTERGSRDFHKQIFPWTLHLPH